MDMNPPGTSAPLGKLSVPYLPSARTVAQMSRLAAWLIAPTQESGTLFRVEYGGSGVQNGRRASR